MSKDTKIYVNRDEFMSQMLKCLGSEEVEGWLSYRITPVPDNFPDDWTEEDDDRYDDDDADCYCE